MSNQPESIIFIQNKPTILPDYAADEIMRLRRLLEKRNKTIRILKTKQGK